MYEENKEKIKRETENIERLIDEIKNKSEKNPFDGVIFKLLNAAKVGNKEEFYGILLHIIQSTNNIENNIKEKGLRSIEKLIDSVDNTHLYKLISKMMR